MTPSLSEVHAPATLNCLGHRVSRAVGNGSPAYWADGDTVRSGPAAKALVAAFASTLERRDWQAFAELLDADVVYEIPQTRERICGRDRYVTFNAEFPGDWHIEPVLLLEDGRDASMLFPWTLDGESALAIAYFVVEAGRITKITDFWPDPYEPPPGREHLTERW